VVAIRVSQPCWAPPVIIGGRQIVSVFPRDLVYSAIVSVLKSNQVPIRWYIPVYPAVLVLEPLFGAVSWMNNLFYGRIIIVVNVGFFALRVGDFLQ